MRNNLRILWIAIAAFTATASGASDIEYFTHHRASVSGTLTSSLTYSAEMGYHYMLRDFAGIGISLGYWKNFYAEGWAAESNWNISSDDECPSNLYLRPSVIIKSPAVRIRDAYLSLYGEPGVMINLPYQRVAIESTSEWPKTDYTFISTTKGQWLAMELRAGICIDIGGCGISAGYMFSNYDINSQYRHLSYRGVSFNRYYPRKPVMHGAFLSLSYNLRNSSDQ